MEKVTQENDESCVCVVGYGMESLLSPRPADCGMPVDGVARQETVGYTRRAPTRAARSRRHRGACLGDDGVRHGVPDGVFPRQAVESNAALIPLDQPTAEDWLAHMVRSIRLISGLRKSRIAATAGAPVCSVF